ncbi:hypothetical protein CDAR_498181 [Caerostris darwini]|uniref:Uncharacterized protein n=1 Tax=Caerostris darwini TaxID=1538125 RepID=A0AAV4M451_9ARAC|nr:hypothetical protein CDAR_498181 [Caerostris darwini]
MATQTITMSQGRKNFPRSGIYLAHAVNATNAHIWPSLIFKRRFHTVLQVSDLSSPLPISATRMSGSEDRRNYAFDSFL